MRKLGHTVVEFDIPNARELSLLYVRLMTADGWKTIASVSAD
jgi:hypothetical protein